MYAFSHWNRRLCLRPELTASVMRAFVDDLQGHGLPLRLHYAGPSFRYERPSRGRSRQFTQVGVELIGASGAAADAEVLHLACAGLESVGIKRYRLVVGHLGAALQLLAQLGMTDHAQGLVLDQMEPIARGRVDLDAAVARVVDLLGGGAGGSANGVATGETVPDLPSALASLPLRAGDGDRRRYLESRQPAGRRRRASTAPDHPALAGQSQPSRPNRPGSGRVRVRRRAARGGWPARAPGDASCGRSCERRGLSTAPVDEVSAALDLLRGVWPAVERSRNRSRPQPGARPALLHRPGVRDLRRYARMDRCRCAAAAATTTWCGRWAVARRCRPVASRTDWSASIWRSARRPNPLACRACWSSA